MKKAYKTIIWIAVVLAIILTGLNIGFLLFGKNLVLNVIERNLKRKATLERVTIGLPLSFGIHKLNIEGLANIEDVSIKPAFLSLFAGKLVLNELNLVRPNITLEMNSDGKLNIALPQSKSKQPPVLLARLKITEGKIVFVDKKIDPAGFKVALNNINLNIAKAAFPPTSLFTRFNLLAALGEDKGKISALGWVDFGPKDMEGELELKDIDLTYLAPYYQKFISEKKLSSAKLNFGSDLRAVKNNLIAKCHIEITDLAYLKEEPADKEKASVDLFPNVMELLSGQGGKIVFDFTVNTKLDNPRINMKEVSGMFAQKAAQNIATQPPDKLKANFKDVEKQFKEIGKTFKDIFKKKEE